MKTMAALAAVLLALGGAWIPCVAQDGVPPPTPDAPLRSSAELDQLLGPIALYPDPLIGLILPASTQPSQIVLADRYVAGGGDPAQIESQSWDASVQGLAHYAAVLKWMDDNIAWTTELGQAFASQQTDVMDSIQRLRSQAQSLGNLSSTPQETVASDDGMIDIDPVDEDNMYVPEYPDSIYAQPGVYCTFGLGLPIGIWLGYDWDWRHHHLISWGWNHPRPRGWWRLSSSARGKELSAPDLHFWRPGVRGGLAVRSGGDRGYGTREQTRPVAAPRTAAPRVSSTERSAGAVRQPEESREPAVARQTQARQPEVSRSVERSAPSESVFGGGQSTREVHESSSRGEMSRGSSPASSQSSGRR
jgi:hypothetical protein